MCPDHVVNSTLPRVKEVTRGGKKMRLLDKPGADTGVHGPHLPAGGETRAAAHPAGVVQVHHLGGLRRGRGHGRVLGEAQDGGHGGPVLGHGAHAEHGPGHGGRVEAEAVPVRGLDLVEDTLAELIELVLEGEGDRGGGLPGPREELRTGGLAAGAGCRRGEGDGVRLAGAGARVEAGAGDQVEGLRVRGGERDGLVVGWRRVGGDGGHVQTRAAGARHVRVARRTRGPGGGGQSHHSRGRGGAGREGGSLEDGGHDVGLLLLDLHPVRVHSLQGRVLTLQLLEEDGNVV